MPSGPTWSKPVRSEFTTFQLRVLVVSLFRRCVELAISVHPGPSPFDTEQSGEENSTQNDNEAKTAITVIEMGRELEDSEDSESDDSSGRIPTLASVHRCM